MDFDKVNKKADKIDLDYTAGIIESLLNRKSIRYHEIVPLYQYNKVAVRGVRSNIPYEFSHTLLEYNIILEGVTRVTTHGDVNLFFRKVSIEEVDVTVTEKHIVPELP